MGKAFLWGFGWTFGRWAALLCIALIVMAFSSKEGRQFILGLLLWLAGCAYLAGKYIGAW